MKKKSGVAIILLVILIIIATIVYNSNKSELKTIKSNKQLENFYNYSSPSDINYGTIILTMPFSYLYYVEGGFTEDTYSSSSTFSAGDLAQFNSTSDDSSSNYHFAMFGDSSSNSKESSSSKDYSTTNIQVENVDEADITKTDGDYIYSISDINVIITDVRNPENISIATTINFTTSNVPEDLLLNNNELVVIGEEYSASKYNTIVSVYNIEDKTDPILVKEYKLYEPYYTSRVINNILYVISSGNLRKDGSKVITYYEENSVQKEIGLNNIKYLKDIKTECQTLISTLDLNNPYGAVDVNSYLMDISNAYVSENAIYLLDEEYQYSSHHLPTIKSMFGLKGIFGAFEHDYDDDDDDDDDYGYQTKIYKFNIGKNGKITYDSKVKEKGETINQYSLDEKDGHLRVALHSDEGSRIAIYDEHMKKIGESDNVAKGETMYSSRFMGDRVYLVTYKNTDPLFVIDLSDEKNPEVLGKLEVSGYSTYLHPYDETHIIGIGMETEEVVNKNSSGKVTSTYSRIVGMKMALFDVSDVNNPEVVSTVVIGDNRTTSAILTNPKALLFSKAKELIAIPVNNYSEDFSISDTTSISSAISSYKNYSKNRVSEGYFVYSINLEDGINLKGVITHEEKQDESKINSYYSYYSYSNASQLLRGLYIEDNLYTVSEEEIQVHNLDSMDLVDSIKIIE
jgi:uncharacterized secreted protein with C-terminal beta-propeller domain